METAGFVAIALFGLLTIFQGALALGAPLGEAAWGGKHEGVLPRQLRIASAITALVIYPAIILAIMFASGIIEGDLAFGGSFLMWALTVFFGLGAVASAVSPSKMERVWAPVSAGIAICCGIIAAGA